MTCDTVRRVLERLSTLAFCHSLTVTPWATLQERPCTRCVKRNIGHLCHDEEPSKKPKAKHENINGEAEAVKLNRSSSELSAIDQRASSQNAGLNLAPPQLHQDSLASSSPIGQSGSVTASQGPLPAGNNPSCGWRFLLFRAQHTDSFLQTWGTMIRI